MIPKSMRAWALPLLRCLECSGRTLETRAADIRCCSCGRTYARRGDIVDFLHRPHPAIVREREAVHKIDREAGAPEDWMRAALGRLNRDELTQDDLASSAHIRAIAESRAQVLELFSEERLTPGSVVLELGADVGWASSLLLAAGCRVIATDITDHLFLAVDGESPNLCRLLADMNRVPLADSTMDVVFAASCVHHSWDLGLTFQEIARVLKPGGTAYLTGEPLPSWLRYVAGGQFGHKERELGINETWIRRDVWLRECRAAGLEPRIVFPNLSDRQLKERLGKRRLPGFLGGALRPLISTLQVSVHLRVRKSPRSKL
jgi:SAM-dependent methyltransferase